jgi:tetratricopeptide (TPR) repeat protein
MMFQTIALCFRGLGDFQRAREYFGRALSSFVGAGAIADATKVEWSLARVLVSEGRLQEAQVALDSIASKFRRLSMRDEEALIALDRVDVLLALGRYVDARRICSPIIATFRSMAGRDREVARALACLHEALGATTKPERIRNVMIPHVRLFIEGSRAKPAAAHFELPPA